MSDKNSTAGRPIPSPRIAGASKAGHPPSGCHCAARPRRHPRRKHDSGASRRSGGPAEAPQWLSGGMSTSTELVRRVRRAVAAASWRTPRPTPELSRRRRRQEARRTTADTPCRDDGRMPRKRTGGRSRGDRRRTTSPWRQPAAGQPGQSAPMPPEAASLATPRQKSKAVEAEAADAAVLTDPAANRPAGRAARGAVTAVPRRRSVHGRRRQSTAPKAGKEAEAAAGSRPRRGSEPREAAGRGTGAGESAAAQLQAPAGAARLRNGGLRRTRTPGGRTAPAAATDSSNPGAPTAEARVGDGTGTDGNQAPDCLIIGGMLGCARRAWWCCSSPWCCGNSEKDTAECWKRMWHPIDLECRRLPAGLHRSQ